MQWLGKDGVYVGVTENSTIVDSEGKFAWEPEGFFMFAVLPRRCRNGKTRWLCTLERHSDGTYTKPADQRW
jgi:hypothetical protein